MQLLLSEFFMQPDATNGTAQPGTSTAPASGPMRGPGGMDLQLILLPVMIGVFYFLMIRPQQKKQRETDEMLKALKRGDVVRTSGGIRGEITDLTDTEATLLIAEKVKINVLRTHIGGKIVPAQAAASQTSQPSQPSKEKP